MTKPITERLFNIWQWRGLKKVSIYILSLPHFSSYFPPIFHRPDSPPNSSQVRSFSFRSFSAPSAFPTKTHKTSKPVKGAAKDEGVARLSPISPSIFLVYFLFLFFFFELGTPTIDGLRPNIKQI